MRRKYLIKINAYDTNRNFGEILDQIKKFLIERDGVELLDISVIEKVHDPRQSRRKRK